MLDFFRKSRSEKTPGPRPKDVLGVSILKPIKGADPSCAENLASFLDQDYPAFEVLFGFRDADDPALPLVSQLAASAPCDARVVVSDAASCGTAEVPG